MRAATEGSLPPVRPQGNLVEVLGREVRQGSPGELMVESTPSRQRRPPCKTNKEKSDEAADAAALTTTTYYYYSVKTGSKRAKNTCWSIPNGLRSLLEKRVFVPFLTHFWSQNGPFSRHFGIFHEPKPVATGSKWAKTTCLSIINGLGSFLKKRIFDPFLTYCWSPNGPFSRHFGIFQGPKRATTGSKRPRITCLSITSGRGTTLKKKHFFRLGDPGGPTVGPHFAWAGRPSCCTK